MIEKMLRTTIVCREEDRDETLLNLRQLGVMHIEHVNKPDHTNIKAVEQSLDRLRKVINVLTEYQKYESKRYSRKNPRALAKLAYNVSESLSDNEKKLLRLHRERSYLEPWGDFAYEDMNRIRSNGVFLYQCIGSKRDLRKFGKYGIVEHVKNYKGKCYFMLISEKKVKDEELTMAPMPKRKVTLNQVNDEIIDVQQKIEEAKDELKSIAKSIDDIKVFYKDIEQQYEFLSNKYGMGEDGKHLAYISGYVPENKTERVINTGKRCGWAVSFNEPAKDENPPTLLKIPWAFTVIKPVFEFIGIVPGYKEWDVSACFLFFFTIFFAMIIGDAGYGVIFLVIGLALKVLYKRKREARLPINLFLILSLATIAWGMLTGTYFGIPQDVLPHELHGLKALTDEKTKDSYNLLICFTLGLVHLTLARFWKAAIYWRSIRGFLGQVGWGLFIFGNYFTALKLIVYPDMVYPSIAFVFYGVGFALIITCFVNWKDSGSLFNVPFEFIGSFVDLLSYIRLFAVGLASLYIAISFNTMGAMVYQLSPWAAVFGILVMVAGHLLNISLGFMGVLVHGIRLNTLEFSNHMELEWAGEFYAPFKVNVQGQNKIENFINKTF